MVTAQRAGALNLIRCTVGAAEAGFDLTRVVGVERGERLVPCPEVPAAVGRIATRAGEWVVYPLAWWLGAEPGDERAGQVILFDTPRGRFGLAVNRVSPSMRAERSRLAPAPRAVGPVAEQLISGVALLDSGPLVLLNPDHLDPTAAEFAEPPPRAPIARARGGAPKGRVLLIRCGAGACPGGRAVGLCLPSENVAEIIPLGSVAPVPTGEEHVRGVIAWRGRPVPVLDPIRWLGLSTADELAPRVVVATLAGVRVALAAPAEVSLLAADVPTIPARRHLPVRLERALGVFDTTDQTLIVPNWELLVS